VLFLGVGLLCNPTALEADMASLQPPRCAICGKPVPLESCKFDENGKAVHEDCYVGRMLEDKDPPPS